MDFGRGDLRNVVLVLALAHAACGCAGTPTRNSPPPAPDAAKPATASAPAPTGREVKIVEFFRNPSDVPFSFREINTVTVVGWGRDFDEMIADLKQRAAVLGADAVILLDDQTTQTCGLDYSKAACTRDSVLMRGIAILYDEDETETETAELPERRGPAAD